MTKGQSWLLIIGVFILIALFMIHNSNESQSAVNRAVADDTICYDNYKKSYYVLEKSILEKNLQDCLEQSRLRNL